MWVGIDFGTTNSAIAFSDGRRVHTFRVDRQEPDLLPSLIYISKFFETTVGTAARDVYLEKNVNRPSLFKPVEVGVIRLDVGGAGGYKEIYQNVIVLVDVLAPGRLLRSVKTGLRTIDYDGSLIFGRQYSVEELIAIVLRHLVAQASAALGGPVKQAVMGRPVKFSDDPRVDRRAEERIAAAARLAGIEEVVFLPEPIAAAYSYHRDFSRPTRTLIFDFGGGTLDLTVAVLGGDAPDILASEGVLIGGDDLDRRLFGALLPFFGRGANQLVRGVDGSVRERPFPEHIWEALLDWQTVEDMKRGDAIRLIEEAATPGGSSDPQALQALYDLIYNNRYYQLLREVERVKIALSTAETATLSFRTQHIQIELPVTRNQFERLINQEIAEIGQALRRVVAEAGLTADDIEFVVTTGGSSLIPAFQRLLAEMFPRARSGARAERNLTGVVQGLAVYGHDRDMTDKKQSETTRSQILEAARTAAADPAPTAANGLPFSHAVIGIDAEGDVQFVPWQGDRPTAEARPVWLTDAVWSSRLGQLLLGTTLSRFIAPSFDDLYTLLRQPDNPPFRLRLDRERAEAFILIDRWSVPDPQPLLVLVTRWGNLRLFQRRLVEQPLQREGVWKLDMREKPDPPAALVGVKPTSELLLATASGLATRVPVRAIATRGSRGLKLKTAEAVFGLALDGVRQFIAVLADGSAERFVAHDIPPAPASGSAGRALLRNGAIVGLLSVGHSDQAMGLTARGRLVELDLSAARQFGGRRRVLDLGRDDQLIRCWQS